MKRKENGKSGAVAFGQLVKGLPLLHGSLQRHTVCNGIAAAGVDSLDLLHLLTGQGVALHGDEGGRPGDHRDNAEQHDDDDIHARRVGVILGRQVVQADEGHSDADDRGSQTGHQLIDKAEQRTHDAGDILAGAVGLVIGAVGDHRDGHIGSGVVCTVADAEE